MNFHHEVLESRRLLSTVSWNVAASGSWNTAADWSAGAVPQPGDDVVISQSGNIKVTLTGSASVHSLTVTGDTLAISGGTVSVAANSSIGLAGALTLSSATLSLASGATLTNSGSITVNPVSQLNVGGAYSATSTGNLTLPSGTFASGVGTNLVDEPGFEDPAANGSTTTGPDGWGQWGSSYVSTAAFHSGAQSLLQYGSNSGVDESFAVSPGVTYAASVFALNPTTGGLTGGQGAFMGVSFTDANGKAIGSPSKFLTVLNSNSVKGSWLNSTTTIVAPSSAASISLDLQVGAYTGISGTSGGSIYWDDVQLGPTAINAATISAASMSNSGTITIGAGDSIAVTGAFTQTTGGVLNDQLGGPAAGNFFGSLSIGGAASLAGTLNVSLMGSYAPTISDGFTILSYASETGSFSTYQLPSGSTYTFQPGVNPTSVGISAVPSTLFATINAAAATTTATANLVGVNLAYWDGYLNTTQTREIVQAAGLSLFRFPGGSASDDYHFNISNNYGDSSANTIPQFAQFITNVGGTGIITTDYGSGSPQEAEAELAYLEGSTTDTTTIGNGIEWSDSANAWQTVNWQTVSYWASLRAATPLATNDGLNFLRISQAAPFSAIKDWEIGNELYGSWETDHHGTDGPGGVSTGAQHDPATYAQFAAAFASFDAGDSKLPTIQIGIDSGDPSGASDNNWTLNVITDLNADGFAPGFISDHSYMQGPGAESDSFLLNSTVSDSASLLDWSTRYGDYQAMLKQVLGSTKAAGVKVMATEFNSNYGAEGKQMTSIVNGIFIADSIGSLLNSGYTGGLVWDLRNGWTTDGNNSSSLYGWREGGDEGILGANQNTPPSTGPYIPYPSYFGEQLASKIIQTGGIDVQAVSNYGELTVYSVMEPNGHLELMVLNKNPDASLTEQFNLSGFTPSGSAQLWQYGEAQDYAQSQSTTGAAALANSSFTLSLNGNNFAYNFPAYSMSVIDLTPKLSVATAAAATPSPTVATAVALTVLGLENGGDSGLTYTWAATGPSTVSYTGSINGTNAAKNITGNFSQAGLYTFVVTITDPGGQTTTSSVQMVLPVFASQTASTLTISLNNIAPINVGTSGTSVTVTQSGFVDSFSGVTSVIVNGSATNNVLNFNGPLTTPFTFSNGGTTTLNVNGGTLTIAAGLGSTINSQLFSTVNIVAGANLVLAPSTSQASRTLLDTQFLSIAGTTGNWTGRLDLNGNDLEIQSGNLANTSDQLKQGAGPSGSWQGSGGIVSSAAAGDATHLTTLGLMSDSSGIAFDNTNPPSTAVLVKYTYYGDATLDGKVDASDYSRIDSGYLNALTGWYNGDFNNDGVINGSDYTLIDNAFNKQTAALNAIVATGIAPNQAKAWATQPIPDAVVFNKGSGLTAPSIPWLDQLLDGLASV